MPLIRVLAFAAALAAPTLAVGNPQIVLDYRNGAFRDREPSYSRTDREPVDRAIAQQAPAALREQMGRAYAILGDAEGAFTRPGARERVYLVQKKRPLAIEPFPTEPAPALILLSEGAQPRFFRMPADGQYQRLVGVADVDRDGRSEVLLEGTFMNMGESATSLTVVRFEPEAETAKPVQVLRDVYRDSCDAGAKRKSRTAATVTLSGSGELELKHHVLRCP